ncbi:MAG: hypothetical protein WAL67_17385, partial [Candidatus Cybelea sp.]
RAHSKNRQPWFPPGRPRGIWLSRFAEKAVELNDLYLETKQADNVQQVMATNIARLVRGVCVHRDTPRFGQRRSIDQAIGTAQARKCGAQK